MSTSLLNYWQSPFTGNLNRRPQLNPFTGESRSLYPWQIVSLNPVIRDLRRGDVGRTGGWHVPRTRCPILVCHLYTQIRSLVFIPLLWLCSVELADVYPHMNTVWCLLGAYLGWYIVMACQVTSSVNLIRMYYWSIVVCRILSVGRCVIWYRVENPVSNL